MKFFYFEIYLAQEQDKTFKLYSNEVRSLNHPLRAFELKKKLERLNLQAEKNNYSEERKD